MAFRGATYRQPAAGDGSTTGEGRLPCSADYRDSAQMVLSDYRRAARAAPDRQPTSLKAAQDLYETLADYKDNATMTLTCATGGLLEEAGNMNKPFPVTRRAATATPGQGDLQPLPVGRS